MRNKILIVDAKEKDREELEQILAEIVTRGGEIFFAATHESALEIIRKERPQLVFLDETIAGVEKNNWIQEGVHIIIMSHKKPENGEAFVSKPFKRHQILEKCRKILEAGSAAPMPPM